MTIPLWVWVCYKCGEKVALRDGEPFLWYEATDYKPGEIGAAFTICEGWPKCEPIETQKAAHEERPKGE